MYDEMAFPVPSAPKKTKRSTLRGFIYCPFINYCTESSFFTFGNVLLLFFCFICCFSAYKGFIICHCLRSPSLSEWCVCATSDLKINGLYLAL